MGRQIVFNSKGAAQFGCRVDGVNPYAAPGRQLQSYTIPGRVGEFIAAGDKGVVPNLVREYKLGLYRDANYANKLQAIREWLLEPTDYVKLQDSYEPGVFFLARFTGDVAPIRKGAGNNFEIPIAFSCLPQRFLDAGETWIEFENGETALRLNNETPNDAYPLAYLVNGGESALTLSLWDEGEQMARASLDLDAGAAVYFDFETTNAYTINLATQENVPQNDLVTAISGDWQIHPGTNIIKRSDAALGVTLKPRWWVR